VDKVIEDAFGVSNAKVCLSIIGIHKSSDLKEEVMKYTKSANRIKLLVLIVLCIQLAAVKNAAADAVFDFDFRMATSYGSVTVTIEPQEAIDEGAQWRLSSGPDTSWHDSGDTIEDIIVGDYTIIFKDIDGWGKLLDKKITVTEGSTTDISVTYKSLKLLIQLTNNNTL
jgi:hypothetical protein